MSITITSIIGGYLLALFAIITLVTRLFYPNHHLIAVIIYAASWIPFLILGYQLIVRHHTLLSNLFLSYGILFALALLLAFFAYLAWVLLPFHRSPLILMEPAELRHSLDDDLAVMLTLHHDSQNIIDELSSNPLIATPVISLSDNEKRQLKNIWSRLFETSVELDILKNKYRGFYQLNYLRHPVEHSESFLLAYLSFITKYDTALQATTFIDQNPQLVRLLNEADNQQAIPKHSYDSLKFHLTSPNELIRLSAGRLHWSVAKPHLAKQHPEHLQLLEQTLSNISQQVDQNLNILIVNPLYQLEHLTFKYWFPIQKKIALHASYIRATTRQYLITPKVITPYQERFKPGDILLERREWHATNVGIPGYWSHSALYTGTLAELDKYFQDIPQLEGQTFSTYLQNNNPQVYAQLKATGDDNYPIRIIESKRPGVIFISLEQSTNADSLAVLRPQISRAEKFTALLHAFSHAGKPYDFEFDFATDNALVCSELIYKAYQETEGLDFDLISLNGRLILPPNNIAKKFADQANSQGKPQLKLILFLDGNEKKKKVIEKSAAEFNTSWQRPKWHIFVQDS